jgi:hypothetical protein
MSAKFPATRTVKRNRSCIFGRVSPAHPEDKSYEHGNKEAEALKHA